MIDSKLEKEILERHGKLNFKGLLEYLNSNGYSYDVKGLIGPLAIATTSGVIVDLDKLNRMDDVFFYFVILHETAHMKRVSKYGKLNMINKLSTEIFEDFMEHIIEEEIFADRFASLIFFSLNKKLFPRNYTQCLHLPHKQKDYEEVVKGYFGKIQNDENKYDELIKSFITN